MKDRKIGRKKEHRKEKRMKILLITAMAHI
jgi:hypothetical protein